MQEVDNPRLLRGYLYALETIAARRRGFKNRDDWYKKQNRVRGKLAASGMHAVSGGKRRESQGSADGGEVWGPDSPVSSPLSPGTGRSGRSRAMFFLFKVQKDAECMLLC